MLYTKVTQQILDRYGKTFEWPLKTKMMGRKPLDGATILVKELQLPMTPEEFHKELYGNLMSMFPDAELMPGWWTYTTCGWGGGVQFVLTTCGACVANAVATYLLVEMCY